MDKPELSHHVAFHVPEQEHDTIHLRPPAISLRSMSKSDPHLCVPHLLLILHSIVLYLACSTLTMLFALQMLHAEILRSSAVSQAATLRKSTSAVDWSGVVGDVQKRNLKPYGWHETVGKTATEPARSGLQLALMNSAHNHDEGLVMSCSNHNREIKAMNAPAHRQEHVPHGLVASASSLNSSNAPLESHGVFGGVFHRGFFSKPVVRSEEENYRYLMALDR
ncbi:hypothetical protein OSTOST_00290 [Ostertagia ostertagi]